MELSDPNNLKLEKVAQALSNDDRLIIIKMLLQKDMCVSDIQKELFLEQSTTSHHLTKLRNTGLIDREQRGVFVYYRIANEYNDILNRIMTLL